MGVLQYPIPIPMTNGQYPNLKFGVFGDNLSTVSTAGYLNQAYSAGAVPLSNADVVLALYSYNQQTQSGTFGIFTVNIATSTGQITLSTWGNPGDMQTTAVNTMSGAGQIILAKANGTEATNAVTASGNAGVITTSSLTTAGGSSYAITWTNALITSTSVILLTIMGGTNTTKNITIQATAGSGTSTLTIYNNTAATALNGTILIGYTIF